MLRAYFAAALLALAGAAGAARADELHVHGDLVCDTKANVALVRFTTSYNEDRPVYQRLPAAVDAGLSAKPAGDRTDCGPAGGRLIRLRIGQEQAFAYGMGGGDPPNFFSLWIDRRKVVSKRVWREGYDKAVQRLPMLVGVVVRPGRLTYCYATERAPEVTCHDEGLNLAKIAVDRTEYGVTKPAPGTVTLRPGSRNPTLCRRYFSALGSQFGWLLEDRSDQSQFDPTTAWGESSQVVGAFMKSMQIAPAPSGQPLRLTLFSGSNHYFDGDVLLVTPPAVASAELTAFWNAEDDLESILARQRPANWTIIGGGAPDLYPEVSTRYVHLRVQQIDRRLFVLAYPTNRAKRPTAVLLAVSPQGRAEPVCEFQRAEPNF